MQSVLLRFTTQMFLAISFILMLPGFMHKSLSAISTSANDVHSPTDFPHDIKYLIAQLNLSSRPFAKSATFNTNIIEQMYRGKWVSGQWQSSDTYAGGLAGAVRRELSKGELVGGVSHLQKGQERLANLKDVITKGKVGTDTLVSSDMDIARALHDDLLSALQTKK